MIVKNKKTGVCIEVYDGFRFNKERFEIVKIGTTSGEPVKSKPKNKN